MYGIRTRSRAVEIFTTCAHMICNMEELEKVREPWAHGRAPHCGQRALQAAHRRGAGTLDAGQLSGVGGSVSCVSLITGVSRPQVGASLGTPTLGSEAARRAGLG